MKYILDKRHKFFPPFLQGTKFPVLLGPFMLLFKELGLRPSILPSQVDVSAPTSKLNTL